VFIASMKIRFAGLILIAATALAVTPLRAENAACCAKGKTAHKEWCADYAKLNLSSEQKTKLTALQAKCMKEGCTEETRAKFLKSAKKFLSADQYAQLRAECDKNAHTEKKQS
jgi:hypothetical protein